jgi:hypothetical protein
LHTIGHPRAFDTAYGAAKGELPVDCPNVD